MIDTNKLELLDGLGYALDEIKAKSKPDTWEAFSKWFGTRPHYLSQTGKKCILQADLQLYIRLRTNALKKAGLLK